MACLTFMDGPIEDGRNQGTNFRMTRLGNRKKQRRNGRKKQRRDGRNKQSRDRRKSQRTRRSDGLRIGQRAILSSLGSGQPEPIWFYMMEPLVQEMKESGHDLNFDGSLIILNQQSMGRSKFEGPMVSSRAIEMFVETKLCPSFLDFEMKKLLGKGASCNVWLCTHLYDNIDHALKIIRLNNDDQIQREPREVTILSDLRNEYIAKFSQAWVESDITVEDEEPSLEGSIESGDESTELECSNYLLIQMEYCPGSLQDYLSPPHKFDAQESFQYFEEITKGLQYIHKEGVIHRDLKPGNVFLGLDGVIKIGDFGQSWFRPNDWPTFEATPNLGTPGFEAPELKAGRNVSEKVDIFPLGVIYLELFNSFKTMAQNRCDLIQFEEGSSQKNWKSKSWNSDSSFCMQLIAKDPLKCPSAADILESLHKSTRLSQKGEKSREPLAIVLVMEATTAAAQLTIPDVGAEATGTTDDEQREPLVR